MLPTLLTGINPPVIKKIFCESENIQINCVSKKCFYIFDQALKDKWGFFLKEEEKQGGKVLKEIDARSSSDTFSISATSMCSPGMRKFKRFFQSPSQEMIQRVLICSSYNELLQLKESNDESLCMVVKTIKQKNPNWNLSYEKADTARTTLLLVKKNNLGDTLTDLNLHRRMFSNDPATNKLKFLPAEIFFTFKNLEVLLCQENAITCIPPELCLAENLETLDLSGNKITTIPPQLFKLENLIVLDLCKNHIACIPSQICMAENLEILDLSENKITRIPPQLFKLENLKALDLCKNHIACIPSEICMAKNLENLKLNKNEIGRIPPQLFKLENLKALDLCKNHIACIPSEICMAKNLEILNLSENKITTIPPQLFKLENLEVLFISQNHIACIPSEICTLKNLQKLELDQNPITSFPNEMIANPMGIRRMHCSGNAPFLIPFALQNPHVDITLDCIDSAYFFLVHHDAGWGRGIYFRGVFENMDVGPNGMTWDKGVPLVCIGDNLWALPKQLWDLDPTNTTIPYWKMIKFKIVIANFNDQDKNVIWEKGQDRTYCRSGSFAEKLSVLVPEF